MWRCRVGRGRLSSGCRGRSCDRGGGLGAIRQQLLQHAAPRLHVRCVVLLKFGLELVVEPADELLRGLLMSLKTICKGC